MIWDEEVSGDALLAKQQCLGLNEQGKKVRPQCPILAECLDTAMILETKYGVWGGKTPHERKVVMYSIG
jgi:hypothetical protein